MRRRGVRGAIAALGAAAMLGSCGGHSGTGDVTLRMWALGSEGERVQPLVRDFERSHPGVHVRVQQIPWTAAHEKLLTAHVGNATPDVAQLGNTWVPEFQALDALVRLDSAVALSAQIDSSKYFAGIWRTNQIGGALYGVPWYVDTRLVFYRKDILARAGYERVPATWSEWRHALEAMRRVMAPGQYPIFLPVDEWAQPVIFGLQSGSTILRDDGRYGAFSDTAFRRGMDFYIGLFRSGLAPAVANVNIANVYQEFARGTLAMWITGPWNIGEFDRRLPAALRDAWDTAPIPGPGGDASRVSLAGGSSLVVFRRSAHPREAWALVEFLSRPDQQLRFWRATGDLPARSDAWQQAALMDEPHMRAFWDQLHHVVPTPQVPEWELIATDIADQAERAVRGREPVPVVLAALDRQVNEVLEKRRWMLARGALAAGATR